MAYLKKNARKIVDLVFQAYVDVETVKDTTAEVEKILNRIDKRARKQQKEGF